jgi:hypothetical protein
MIELAGMLTIVPIIFFISAVYGIIWVVNISSLIARERQHDTFDVLSTLPMGALGASWTICVACLQQNRSFANVSSSNTWKGRLVIIGFVLLALAESIAPIEDSTERLLLYTVYGLAFGLVLYADHLQSIVLCVLVGMLAPTYTRTRFDAPLYAFGLFLAAQGFVYLTTVLLLMALSAVLVNLRVDEVMAGVSLVVLSLVYFCVAHELINVVLWRTLLWRLNADSSELDFPFVQPL